VSPLIRISRYGNTIIKDGENDKVRYLKDSSQIFSNLKRWNHARVVPDGFLRDLPVSMPARNLNHS